MTTANGARVVDDPNVFPNLGLRYTLDLPATGADGHQYNFVTYLGNWTGVEFGVTVENGKVLPYAVAWDTAQETVFQKFGNKSIGDEPHTFEFVWDSGTKWDFVIDGKVYANNVNLGTMESAGIDGPPTLLLAEVWEPAPEETVKFSDFQYLSMDKVWTDIPAATYFNTGADWPTEGHLQNPEIPEGDFWVGDDLLNSATWTNPPEYLWDLSA